MLKTNRDFSVTYFGLNQIVIVAHFHYSTNENSIWNLEPRIRTFMDYWLEEGRDLPPFGLKFLLRIE